MNIANVKDFAVAWIKKAQNLYSKLDTKPIVQAASNYKGPAVAALICIVISYIAYQVLKDKKITLETFTKPLVQKTHQISQALLQEARPYYQTMKPHIPSTIVALLAPYLKSDQSQNKERDRLDESHTANPTTGVSYATELAEIVDLIEDENASQKEVHKALRNLRQMAPKLSPQELKQAQPLYGSLLKKLQAEILQAPTEYTIGADDRVIEVPDDGSCGFHSWLIEFQLQSGNGLQESVLSYNRLDTPKALAQLRSVAVEKEKELLKSDSVFENTLRTAIFNEQFYVVMKFFENCVDAELAVTLVDDESFEPHFDRYFEEAQKHLLKPFASKQQALEYFQRFKQMKSSEDSPEMLEFQVSTELCLLTHDSISDDEFHKYFAKMELSTTWAQLPEHYALAKRYKLPVCIFVKDPNAGENWPEVRKGRIKRLTQQGEKLKDAEALVLNEEAAQSKPWIIIEQVNGNHFNAIVH